MATGNKGKMARQLLQLTCVSPHHQPSLKKWQTVTKKNPKKQLKKPPQNPQKLSSLSQVALLIHCGSVLHSCPYCCFYCFTALEVVSIGHGHFPTVLLPYFDLFRLCLMGLAGLALPLPVLSPLKPPHQNCWVSTTVDVNFWWHHFSTTSHSSDHIPERKRRGLAVQQRNWGLQWLTLTLLLERERERLRVWNHTSQWWFEWYKIKTGTTTPCQTPLSSLQSGHSTIALCLQKFSSAPKNKRSLWLSNLNCK